MLRINCDDTAATLRSRRGKALGPGFVVSQEHTNFLIFTMPAVMWLATPWRYRWTGSTTNAFYS